MKRNGKKRYMDDHEESWAVSYADLLMVLMSFFIVFFNLESGSGEQNLVDVISKSFKGEGTSPGKYKSKGDGIAPFGGVGVLISDLKETNLKFVAIDGSGNTIRDGKLSGIKSDLDKVGVGELPRMRGLIIELPDDIFEVGAYDLNSKTKSSIDEILAKISSYSEKLAVVAIGHSDTIPMRGDREIIKSNFILSSLRASKAVEYIVGKGFNTNWVFGQAVSVENRASRSLSIKIYERF